MAQQVKCVPQKQDHPSSILEFTMEGENQLLKLTSDPHM